MGEEKKCEKKVASHYSPLKCRWQKCVRRQQKTLRILVNFTLIYKQMSTLFGCRRCRRRIQASCACNVMRLNGGVEWDRSLNILQPLAYHKRSTNIPSVLWGFRLFFWFSRTFCLTHCFGISPAFVVCAGLEMGSRWDDSPNGISISCLCNRINLIKIHFNILLRNVFSVGKSIESAGELNSWNLYPSVFTRIHGAAQLHNQQ